MKPRHWRYVWGVWVAYFAVAETKALRSGDPEAPFCHVLRTTLGIRHPHPVARQAGQIALGAGIVWLVAHLYEDYNAAS
jgi:hypothetical protein